MKINLPRREWFTHKELAAEWGVDLSDILHLLEANKLENSCLVTDGLCTPRLFKEGEDIDEYLYSSEPDRFPETRFSTKTVISLKDVEHFENKWREQINNERNTHITMPPYLDPSHEHYSEELAFGVNTWVSLYGGNGKYSPKRGHKHQIKAELAGKGLSCSAIERITTVVNPNKKGGAPAIED